MQVVGGSFDPTTNIMQGAAHLRNDLNEFDQNLPLALASYNAGPGNVHLYGGIPPFAETQKYVPEVIGLLNNVMEPIFYQATTTPPVDNTKTPATSPTNPIDALTKSQPSNQVQQQSTGNVFTDSLQGVANRSEEHTSEL